MKKIYTSILLSLQNYLDQMCITQERGPNYFNVPVPFVLIFHNTLLFSTYIHSLLPLPLITQVPITYNSLLQLIPTRKMATLQLKVIFLLCLHRGRLIIRVSQIHFLQAKWSGETTHVLIPRSVLSQKNLFSCQSITILYPRMRLWAQIKS